MRSLLAGLGLAAALPAAAGGQPPDPPDTTISSGPPPIVASDSASFTFSSSQAGSTFACALDSAAFQNCSSPATISVPDGEHRFFVIAIRQVSRAAGVAFKVAPVTVPGTLTVRAVVSRRAPLGDAGGFVMLSHGGQTRRIPYWLRVSAPLIGSEARELLHGPGIYHGDTRKGRALVTSYRYPSSPSAVGVLTRLPGPEQVFRFVLHRPVANAGAVVISQGPGVHVSPRLVRNGSQDRLAGFTALPLRINPYQPGYYGIEPVVGVFRPTPGAYDLVFDTRNRARAGPFSFRFWVNDVTPPRARLLTHAAASRGRLRIVVSDRGSGVDPDTMFAEVDGNPARLVYTASTGVVQVALGPQRAGRHRLVFSVADNQETKNTENAHLTLPNTRRLTATFTVR